MKWMYEEIRQEKLLIFRNFQLERLVEIWNSRWSVEKKLQKWIILAYLSKKLKKHAFIIRCLEEKYKVSKCLGNFWRTLNWKIEIELFLAKFLPKIEPSEIRSFFYNRISPFLRGTFRKSPLAVPMGLAYLEHPDNHFHSI